MNKPDGKWKCRACGSVWEGSQLVLDTRSTAIKWTCPDYFCGGTCDQVKDLKTTDDTKQSKDLK